MLRIATYLFPLIFLLHLNQITSGQKIDSTSFVLNSRLSFYSFEKSGELLLHIPASLTWTSLNIDLKAGTEEITSWKGVPGKKILRVPFNISLRPGGHLVKAEITSARGTIYTASTILTILIPKENEVKTDRFTGGLIVNKRIFFPFGFYCYSPVYPGLPEEETVKGFNMISPYQKILPGTFNERKAYMDRCAQLGMKVHYNLLSVSGGGGVSSKIEGLADDRKRERLISEILAFRDHPALLAWYISDEPTGNRITPEDLEKVYRIVKENDPWHPVSIVFMAPFLSSRKYANALDIVMADPYPVPNAPITQVGTVTGQLRSEFDGQRPVWIVPQAFGGGEWWGREPTLHELRSMTYQSIINGARGIQYFVRHGLNSFPKSTAAWNECGRMALEIAELTPWLLSDEDPLPVHSGSGNIQVSSALHDGQLLILAVNKANTPLKAEIRISGWGFRSARVLFENRTISISSGVITDYIPAFGSQAYMGTVKSRKESILPFRGNLLKDPGFEDISTPGVPASCYAWNEGDRGATFFVDSREHIEGDHSVRLITPQQDMGSRLRFFPVNVRNGRTYMISVWAKADVGSDKGAGNNLINRDSTKHKPKSPYFEIGLGEFGTERFYPVEEWQQFMTSVTIPVENILPYRQNVILRMPGAGTGWFDMIQIFEATDINRSINPDLLESWSTRRR